MRGEGGQEGHQEQTNQNTPVRLRQGLSEGEGAGLGGQGVGELLPGKGQCLVLTRLPSAPIPGLRTWVPVGDVSRQLLTG